MTAKSTTIATSQRQKFPRTFSLIALYRPLSNSFSASGIPLAIQTTPILGQIDAEPHVLVHGDFHAGNMLAHEGRLVGVVDWEFSGTYPLSELVGAIAILQISGLPNERDGMTEQEEDRWHARYLEELQLLIKERGWKDEDVTALMGGGHRMLQKARSIMFPEESVEEVQEDQ